MTDQIQHGYYYNDTHGGPAETELKKLDPYVAQAGQLAYFIGSIYRGVTAGRGPEAIALPSTLRNIVGDIVGGIPSGTGWAIDNLKNPEALLKNVEEFLEQSSDSRTWINPGLNLDN